MRNETKSEKRQRKAVPVLYALIFVLMSNGAVTAFNIYYTNHVSQNICGIVNILDGVYASTPPQTPIGRRLATEVHKAKLGYGC
jgi:hypothetical protein